MALPESDQRELVCADRERRPSQLSSDPARVPVGRKDPWSIVRIFSLTTARASTGRRTARGKGLRSHGCHCATLSKNK